MFRSFFSLRVTSNSAGTSPLSLTSRWLWQTSNSSSEELDPWLNLVLAKLVALKTTLFLDTIFLGINRREGAFVLPIVILPVLPRSMTIWVLSSPVATWVPRLSSSEESSCKASASCEVVAHQTSPTTCSSTALEQHSPSSLESQTAGTGTGSLHRLHHALCTTNMWYSRTCHSRDERGDPSETQHGVVVSGLLLLSDLVFAPDPENGASEKISVPAQLCHKSQNGNRENSSWQEVRWSEFPRRGNFRDKSQKCFAQAINFRLSETFRDSSVLVGQRWETAGAAPIGLLHRECGWGWSFSANYNRGCCCFRRMSPGGQEAEVGVATLRLRKHWCSSLGIEGSRPWCDCLQFVEVCHSSRYMKVRASLLAFSRNPQNSLPRSLCLSLLCQTTARQQPWKQEL